MFYFRLSRSLTAFSENKKWFEFEMDRAHSAGLELWLSSGFLLLLWILFSPYEVFGLNSKTMSSKMSQSRLIRFSSSSKCIEYTLSPASNYIWLCFMCISFHSKRSVFIPSVSHAPCACALRMCPWIVNYDFVELWEPNVK